MIEVKSITRIMGMQRLAEELGVTRGHLYKVIRGERQGSERVRAVLEANKIKIRKARRAK